MSRESVLDAIEKELEVHSIKINGNNKDKSVGFYIIMNTQQVISTAKEIFHGIKNSTIELLEEAEVPFDILTGGKTSQTTRETSSD